MESPKKGLIIAMESGTTRYALIEDCNLDLGPNSYLFVRWQDGQLWSAQPEVLALSSAWRTATPKERRVLPPADSIAETGRKKKEREPAKDDPMSDAEHRRLLEEYFSAAASQSEVLEKTLRSFWNALVALRPDRPGRTWRMRTKTIRGKNPVILIRNPQTLNDVQLAHFWATVDEDGSWISIIALKEWLSPDDAGLFPDDGEFYGDGCGVDIRLEDFDESALNRYSACFREILRRHGDLG